MKIRTRLTLISSISYAVMLLIICFLIWSFTEVVKTDQNLELVQKMREIAFERTILRDEYLQNQEERVLIQWKVKTAELRKLLGTASDRLTKENERVFLNEIKKHFENNISIFSKIVLIRKTEEASEKSRTTSIELEKRLTSQLLLKSYALNDNINKLAILVDRASKANDVTAVIIVIFCVAAAVITTIVISLLVTRILKQRFKKLSEGITLIGSGNLDYRIDATGEDKLSSLALLTNEMATKLKNSFTSIENLQKEMAERQQAEAALLATEERLRLKLDSTLSPDAAIIDEELSNILDTSAIQSLMEDFTSLTGMVMALLDLKGKVLVATGWQDICTQFHRVHPQTAANCTASDLFLAQNLRPGEYVAYKCQNHLWDVATPLFIGDKHVGNIYTGQFFYDDEPVDEQLFIDQAAKYGFDQEAYLSALHRVPRISRARVKPLMDFLTKFSALVSKLSFSNLKLAQAISEQQRIEGTLRQSKEHFRRLTKLSPVPVLIINRQGDIEYLNDRFLTTFGYDLDDIPNLEAWWRRAYPDESLRHKGMANWRKAAGKAARDHADIEPFEARVTCKDGTVRIAEIISARIGSQNLVILQDISERKQAEEEIVRQSGQLRALAARLADVEETGREHLARELHDQVCQSLTSLSLTLNLLQTQMPPKAAAKLRGRMAEAVALVEQIGETVRDVMADLRPPMLDDYGLLSALHWYGTEFSDKTGIGVDVQGREAVPRLAPPVELALFRIVQEALANVAKHARATGVVLNEAEDNGTIRLVIADNGVGFDQERLGQPEGRHLWGLMTMSERAAAVGGRCRIDSHPGRGTRVVVEVSRETAGGREAADGQGGYRSLNCSTKPKT